MTGAHSDQRLTGDRQDDDLLGIGARHPRAYLRVDTIETTVVRTTPLEHPVGPVGYAVANSLAAEQLRLGLDVILVLDTAMVDVDEAVATIQRAQPTRTGR